MQIFEINDSNLVKIESNLALFNNVNTFSIISPKELESITDIQKVAKYALKECELNSHHLRIDPHTEYTYGILSVLQVDRNSVQGLNFNFLLTNSSLILVNKGENIFLEKFILNITSKDFIELYEKVTPQVLFLHLLNDIIENNEFFIEKIENDLEKLEEKILNNASKEFSKEIISKRRLIMKLKHKIASFPLLVKTLSDNENGLFNEKQLKTISILDYKATKMVENATLLRDYASQVREAFESERDLKTNDLMKIFTIVTSIFLPPTLIVGWYGMNFTGMPELSWKYGYIYVIVLNIIVVIGLILFLKRKKFIK